MEEEEIWSQIEDNDKIIEEFRGYKDGLVRYGPKGWVFLPKTAKMISSYKVNKYKLILK